MVSRGLRRLVRKLSISLLSLVIVIGALELACRAAGYAPANYFQWVSDPDVQAISMPDQDTWFGHDDPISGETKLPVRINRYSQRGADYPLEKARSELRLIVLGDSLTFGQGVRDHETIPAYLAERYRPGYSEMHGGPAAARTPHVINAGVNGWSSWHYMRWTQSRIERFRPDLLVVGLFLGNDSDPVTAGHMAVTVPFESQLRNSALYRFLVETYRQRFWKRIEAAKRGISVAELEQNLESYRGVVQSDLPLEEQLDGWLCNSLDYMEQLRDACRTHGVRLACLLIPSHAMLFVKDAPVVYDFVRLRLADLEIDTIECLDPLRQAGEGVWLAWDSGHLNPQGNCIVARALAEGLERLGLLPGPP